MTTANVPVHVAKKEKESSFYLSCLSSSFPSINVISNNHYYTPVIINTSLSLSKAQDIVPSRTFPFMEAKSQVATEHAEGQQPQCSADTIRMGFSVQPEHNHVPQTAPGSNWNDRKGDIHTRTYCEVLCAKGK